MGRHPASHGGRLPQKMYMAKPQTLDLFVGQIHRLRKCTGASVGEASDCGRRYSRKGSATRDTPAINLQHSAFEGHIFADRLFRYDARSFITARADPTTLSEPAWAFIFSLKIERSPRLKRFELCCDMLTYGSQGTDEKSWLWDFLVSFEGLQSLRLRLSNFKSAAAQIVEVIRRHRGTLTDFVYHETCLMSIDQHGLYEENRDITPSWLPNFCEFIGSSQFKKLALCASLKTLVCHALILRNIY